MELLQHLMLTELQLENLLVHLTLLEVKFTSQTHLEVQIIQLRIFQIEISQDPTLVEEFIFATIILITEYLMTFRINLLESEQTLM